MKKLLFIIFIFLVLASCSLINKNFIFNESDIKSEEIIKAEFNYDMSKINKRGYILGGQDGAIYNNFVFSFDGNGNCNVNTLNDLTKVATFTLDKSDINAPHSNSVFFSNRKYDGSDEFPLLYSNIYNNDSSKIGQCNVYRIKRDGYSFTSELVQIIKIGFTDDTDKWATGSRPYGNFIADTDNNELYCYVMDSGINKTKFYKFNMPSVHDGVYNDIYDCNYLTLNYSDVITTFNTPYMNYIQGCCYSNGFIITTEGFTNDSINIPSIRIINLSTKSEINYINMPNSFDINVEPEFICEYNDRLYYKGVDGILYYFKGIE